MRFESKHSFFKQVARHTNCFKNIALTLATKHQFMLAYNIHSSLKKTSLEVTKVSVMPVDILNEAVVSAMKQRFPDVSQVHMAKNVTCSGIHYSEGMLIVHGSEEGLPKFHEIIQICLLREKLYFIVKGQCAWYRAHYHAFELSASTTTEVALIEVQELQDPYPLAEYVVESLRMVTLKRYVIVEG